MKKFRRKNFVKTPPPKRIPINGMIRAKEVRLIDETGQQAGVVPLQEALDAAKEKGLDLIQLTEKVEPPVCKLGEYGKYLYQQEKKGREAKKNIKGGELKEVRLTYSMSSHDQETRARQAEKFLQKGDRVRITLPLRGRQKALGGYATEKIEAFIQTLNNSVQTKVERELKREPRGLSIIVIKG